MLKGFVKHNFGYSLCLLFVTVTLAGFGNVLFAVDKNTNDALNAAGDVTVTYEASRNNKRNGLTKFMYEWKRSFRYNYSCRTLNGKTLVTIKVKAQIDPTISHRILMPSEGKGHPWHARLLDHEYDHVAVSSDDRVVKLLKNLVSNFVIKGVQVSSRDKITKEFIDARINDQLGKYENAVEEAVRSNYILLDKITIRGKKAIPDRDLFFSQLYGRANLQRHKFAYLERAGSLLDSKEYAKANVSHDEPEYLSCDIPDNAVEKKGPQTSIGESLEYWVGDRLVARKTVYPNGKVAALVMYNDRRQHGPHRGWHENGAKSFESYFNKGVQCHFSRAWHDNGKLKTEMFFANGFRHGRFKQWNRNGQLLGQSIFDMGTGTAGQWHENGTLKRTVQFKKGKLHGIWKEWDKDQRPLPDAAKFYFEGKQIDKADYQKAKTALIQ